MSLIKSALEIERMRQGGNLLGEIRDKLLDEIKIGVTPLEIDTLAKKLIKEVDGKPSFMTVKNYQWATCISVNNGVVHGIPTHVPFNEGDVVGLDVGLLYKGLHTDTSWTKIVHSSSPPRRDPANLINQMRAGKFNPSTSLRVKVQSDIVNFVHVGEEALKKAIAEARSGNRVGHISQAIQTTVESAGYSVVESLVGHGVGSSLHESPQIPGILKSRVEKTLQLRINMVIAIEVIYNKGRAEIVYQNNDGWSLASADGSLSGLFEQTVWISDNGPIVLTRNVN